MPDLMLIPFGALGLVLLIGSIALMIRLWGTLGQASEYFARENEGYRREYERQHRLT